jgi:hypothetical protein
MEKIFYTVTELSEILRISISSVNRLKKPGNILYKKYIQVGRRILFPQSIINSIILEQQNGLIDTN